MAAKDGRDASDLDDPSLLNDDVVVDDGADVATGGEPSDKDAGKTVKKDDDGAGVTTDVDGEFQLELADDFSDSGAGVLEEAEAAPEGGQKEGKYSREVWDRIGRERRIAREARARAEAAHAARVRAETDARQAQREALETTEAAIEMQIEATKSALLKAKEDGKSSDEVDLQTKLGTLTARKESVGAARERLKQQEEDAKRGGTPEANPLAIDWKRRNPWYGNQRFLEQTLITRSIDAALSHEGYDKQSAEYFAELDRRVRRRMPELQKFSGGKPQQRHPQAPVRRSVGAGGEGDVNGSKVTLNRVDFANMRNFGLDPNSKEDQREYARQKLSRVREERRSANA